MQFRFQLAPIALIVMLASCAAPPAPEPAPRPAPPPRPAAPPPRPPSATDWRDIALTPGDWRYADGEAVFAMPGGGTAFILRCDRAAGRVELIRPAGGGTRLRIRTSSSARSLAGADGSGGVTAALPASDPFLDAIAFSRGRFSVESDSGAMLVLPAWPEPARVVEDCRG